jgi:L-fuculose-phosphate aldolase
VGSGGNLSAREPGADTFLVTASGTWLDRLCASDFSQVALDSGRHLAGPAPTSELALHIETYRARPDVNAIVHLHPQSVLLLDAVGVPIMLATTDHEFYLRDVATVPFANPGTARLAELAAAACIGGVNALILSRHGCSVLGESVELAHKRALYLEEAATMSFRAALLDRDLPPVPLEFREATTT